MSCIFSWEIKVAGRHGWKNMDGTLQCGYDVRNQGTDHGTNQFPARSGFGSYWHPATGVAAWWVVIESGAERSLAGAKLMEIESSMTAPARWEVTRATYNDNFFDVPNIRPVFDLPQFSNYHDLKPYY
jgi:hypothetical protein